MKEITNINQKGEYHGYQERYSPTSNKLWYRGNYKNDEQIGYVESNWKGSEGKECRSLNAANFFCMEGFMAFNL